MPVEELVELARKRHLGDDVAAAHELAAHVELRHGGPVGVLLDALADGVVGEHVHVGELDAHVVEHARDLGGEAALRHGLGALHEEHHVVALDGLVDARLGGGGVSGGHLGLLFGAARSGARIPGGPWAR